MKNTIILLSTLLFINISCNAQKFKFNTQTIYEVEGQPISKKIFYEPSKEASFEIKDDKIIIWIYQSPKSGELVYAKFFIQKKDKETRKGVDITVYDVIDSNNFRNAIISKAVGLVNGESKEMFEVLLNMDEKPQNNVYNFKMRFTNQ